MLTGWANRGKGHVNHKVFCIGFHKTGTTSLARALRQLGYSVTGPNGTKDPDIGRTAEQMIYRLAEQFDAFQDNPWPMFYKELDQKFPGSKFILTLRPSEAWIRSQVRHFGTRETPMRTWIYGIGCPQGNEAVYVERFERHNREVLSYFGNRKDDLLVMDFAKGDGWQKLAPFLGKEIPDLAFPHVNRAAKGGKGRNPISRLMRRGANAVSILRRRGWRQQ